MEKIPTLGLKGDQLSLKEGDDTCTLLQWKACEGRKKKNSKKKGKGEKHSGRTRGRGGKGSSLGI